MIKYREMEWDSFILNSKDPQILQTSEWAAVKARSGWTPLNVMVGGAGASILKRKLPYLNKSLFYAPRGPVWDGKDRKALDQLLAEIKELAGQHQAIALKIDPEIEENDQTAIALLKSRGFKVKKKQVQPRATFFLDISKSLDELLMGFEEKTRYNIRLSEKKAVKVKEVNSEEGVEIFYALYQETAKRDEFLIHPRKYYQDIYELLNQKEMATIFIAFLDNIPIAAVWMFKFRERLWYMYGASMSAFRNVMPNHALHWAVIKWAKDQGLKTYDLWGIPVDPKPEHPLFGVYRFKKGFQGEYKKFVGAMDLVYDPIIYWLFDQGLDLYKNARSLLTKGRIEDSLGE